MTSHPSKFVLGIDFGTEFSGASIAYEDDIFNIFTVNRWDDNIRKYHPYLSTILYKNDGTVKCGIADSDVNPNDGVYVSNIGQYLYDIDKANKKLGEMKEGLTIQKVVADYLKEFVKLALERLDDHKKFTKTEYCQKYFDIDDLSNIYYSLVYPTSEPEGFMRQCFLDAGIIDEDDAEDRLKIITAAEANAYHQLSLGRRTTNIKIEQNYLVCNIGEVSVDIAKFYADTTESFSTVELISDDPKAGSINLEYKFKKYLEENITLLNLNSMIIDKLIEEFIEKYKFGFDIHNKFFAFETVDENGSSINITVDDLNNEVFLPFIETIIQLIVDADQEKHSNILLCGKYSSNDYFMQKLSEKNIKYIIRHIEESDEAISSGAVSFRLHTGMVQIPYANNLKEDVKVMIEDLGEPEENYGNNEYDFIIGIDFGTSFSGCSYIRLKDGKPHPDCRYIKTKKEKWPGGNSVEFGKTPTLFMYDKKMNPYLWGEEARVRANHNPDLTLLGNFKLFLCPNSLEAFYGEGNEKIELIKDQSGMDKVLAVDIIADYLKAFKNHVLEYIINNETKDSVNFFNKAKIFKKYKYRYVITVPAMWNASARETMAHAAIKATIIKQTELDKLLIISEPEAAAIYCEKRFAEYLEKPESDLNGTRFIVCNAGGGTVDLVTFRLDTEDKEGNKLEKAMICQMGDGIGDICGSMYLDLKFKKYLQTFYNDIGVNVDINEKKFDNAVHQFISKHKPNFQHNTRGDSYIDIELPGKGVLPVKSHRYLLSNDNTTLRMSNEDMKTKVFDEIVGDVIKLIDSQKKQAEKDNANIGGVLMVGGFSRSKYLQQRVRENFNSLFPVSVPYEGVNAISHGAVSYALNPGMISKKHATQSFGLEVCAPFDKEDIVDRMSKKVQGPLGINYTKNRLKYFIEKDQKLDGEKRNTFIIQVQVEYPKNAVIAIFSSDSKEKANSRYVTDSHTKIMEKRINFPLGVKGVNIGDLIDFDVRVQMEHIGATVTVECKNESINRKVSELTKNKSPSLKLFSRCDLDVVKCKKDLISYSLANSGYSFEIRQHALTFIRN